MLSGFSLSLNDIDLKLPPKNYVKAAEQVPMKMEWKPALFACLCNSHETRTSQGWEAEAGHKDEMDRARF